MCSDFNTSQPMSARKSKELGKKVCKKSSKELAQEVCKKSSKELGKKVGKKSSKELGMSSDVCLPGQPHLLNSFLRIGSPTQGSILFLNHQIIGLIWYIQTDRNCTNQGRPSQSVVKLLETKHLMRGWCFISTSSNPCNQSAYPALLHNQPRWPKIKTQWHQTKARAIPSKVQDF